MDLISVENVTTGAIASWLETEVNRHAGFDIGQALLPEQAAQFISSATVVPGASPSAPVSFVYVERNGELTQWQPSTDGQISLFVDGQRLRELASAWPQPLSPSELTATVSARIDALVADYLERHKRPRITYHCGDLASDVHGGRAQLLHRYFEPRLEAPDVIDRVAIQYLSHAAAEPIAPDVPEDVASRVHADFCRYFPGFDALLKLVFYTRAVSAYDLPAVKNRYEIDPVTGHAPRDEFAKHRRWVVLEDSQAHRLALRAFELAGVAHVGMSQASTLAAIGRLMRAWLVVDDTDEGEMAQPCLHASAYAHACLTVSVSTDARQRHDGNRWPDARVLAVSDANLADSSVMADMGAAAYLEALAAFVARWLQGERQDVLSAHGTWATVGRQEAKTAGFLSLAAQMEHTRLLPMFAVSDVGKSAAMQAVRQARGLKAYQRLHNALKVLRWYDPEPRKYAPPRRFEVSEKPKTFSETY